MWVLPPVQFYNLDPPTSFPCEIFIMLLKKKIQKSKEIFSKRPKRRSGGHPYALRGWRYPLSKVWPLLLVRLTLPGVGLL
jgi:hypothetical protein